MYSLNEKVIELLKQGKKLEAVALYKAESKCDIKSAKEYVDRVESTYFGKNTRISRKEKKKLINQYYNTLTELVKQGKSEEAVQLFMNITGEDAQRAKSFIRLIDDSNNGERYENIILPENESKIKRRINKQFKMLLLFLIILALINLIEYLWNHM